MQSQLLRNDMKLNDIMEHSFPLNYSIQPEELAVQFITYLSFEHMPAPKLQKTETIFTQICNLILTPFQE